MNTDIYVADGFVLPPQMSAFVIMAALRSRCGHYIFAPFLLLSFVFFPCLIAAVVDWMSTILPNMVWPWCAFRMQVWNMLHAASWKYRTPKMTQKSPSAHHCTTLSGCIFATKAHIDNRKNLVKQQYLPHMSSQYGKLRPISGWDPLASLGHSSKFQQVSHLGSVTAQHSSSGRQPNFAALNRGRHLYSAGRQSHWALAHMLVMVALCNRADHYIFALLFLSVYLLLLLSFFPRLISASVGWMSTILWHMVWP